MLIERRHPQPWFSICIPQYNRTSFLIESLRSIRGQSFRNLEVCISDDCSTDGRENELVRFLQDSGLSFAYFRQPKNLRYDANLRSAIQLAQGRFALLLGNDDGIFEPSTLERLFRTIQSYDNVGLVITNYQNADDGFCFHRVQRTGLLGNGPRTAAQHFRDLSFVSGLCLDVERSKANTSENWDGSEMYQVYLGCRILAEGRYLLGIDQVAILRGIQIRGENVDSYARKIQELPGKRRPKKLPLTRLAPLVSNAISPYVQGGARQALDFELSRDLLTFTYLYWLFDYRKVGSWRYALHIAWQMRPGNSLKGIPFGLFPRMLLNLLYAAITLVGMTVPVSLFFRLYPTLYLWVKSRNSATESGEVATEKAA